MDFQSLWAGLLNAPAVQAVWNALVAFHQQPILGSLAALIGLIIILLTLWRNNKNTADLARQYRHYEMALVVRDKLSVHRLVDYHRGIAWRDFAAIGAATGIGGAAIMFSGNQLSLEMQFIVVVSIGAQVGATIMMMICDFIHTNTISPLVPPLRRMKIVGDSIVLGGGAMIFNIAAVISFMAVFSPWVSVFCSIIFIITVSRLSKLREIEISELRKWLKLEDQALWDEIDTLVRRTNKKERDKRLAAWFAEHWSPTYEDPCRER
ncbi:MAG: hypothetical protein AB7J28_12205 [Hyphomonadaceae bacterium]